MKILLAPVVVAILLILAIIACVFKKWRWATALAVLFFVMNYLTQSIALHPFYGSVSASKSASTLRVMTYNLWNGGPYMAAHDSVPATELIHAIDSMYVDVFVVCELDVKDNSEIIDSLKARFPYASHDLNTSYNATEVFSKYPIDSLSLRKLQYKDSSNVICDSESWLMTINTPEGRINLAAIHLASNRYGMIRDKMKATSSWIDGRDEYIAALKKGYDTRAGEARALRDSLTSMQGRVIVMGDFNDIGGSYAVKHIMDNNLKDAWWDGGFGYGFTYDMYHLLLRLDHILFSKEAFDLKGVKVLSDWKYSDHYPIVADLCFKQ